VGKSLPAGYRKECVAEAASGVFFLPSPARNVGRGRSLTDYCDALMKPASRMGRCDFEEFKGTCKHGNLSRPGLADKARVSAIDIQRSGTRKDECCCGRRIEPSVGLSESAEPLSTVEAMGLLMSVDEVEVKWNFWRRCRAPP